jgi:hypothetical protein
MNTSGKWWKLAWSAAILTALTIYFTAIPNQGSDGVGIFGSLFVCWLICLPVSVLIVVFRLFRMIGRTGFVYVFVGLSCFYLGNCGLFLGIGEINRDALWVGLYCITIFIGIFILLDSFIIEIRRVPSKKLSK